MRSFAFILAAAALSSVLGHPGGHKVLSRAEFDKRQLAARERHLAARTCASSINSFHKKRKERRALAKRGIELDMRQTTSTSSASPPHFTEIQNFTCVTAPEVTEGPYYINNELVRQDVTEDQTGVPLVLDVGLLDINTCQPLPNAFVEIWAANATGVYGSYPATLGALPPPPTSSSGGPAPSGSGAPPGGGLTLPLERNETFLRGGFATDDNGIVELTTIYPGFYQGRTAHVHTMIHLNYDTAPNGTLISHSGSLLHIGQFFFDESWNDQVYATSPYTDNTNNRTLNDEDDILDEEAANGNKAFMDLELLEDGDISQGILGYITVGVNASSAYAITNTNYLNSTGSDESSVKARGFQVEGEL